jgi:hypothetical protein
LLFGATAIIKCDEKRGGKKIIQKDRNNSLLGMMGDTTFEFRSASWDEMDECTHPSFLPSFLPSIHPSRVI